MKKKKKKYELTGLTFQIRLTRHTLNSHRESLIIKKKKTNKWVNQELTRLTCQTRLACQIRNPCHGSLITK
jgi:hypothetical protein